MSFSDGEDRNLTEHPISPKLLIDMMDSGDGTHQRRLSELRGLGKEIWQGIDAQEYVDQLRDEWDDRT